MRECLCTHHLLVEVRFVVQSGEVEADKNNARREVSCASGNCWNAQEAPHSCAGEGDDLIFDLILDV